MNNPPTSVIYKGEGILVDRVVARYGLDSALSLLEELIHGGPSGSSASIQAGVISPTATNDDVSSTSKRSPPPVVEGFARTSHDAGTGVGEDKRHTEPLFHHCLLI